MFPFRRSIGRAAAGPSRPVPWSVVEGPVDRHLDGASRRRIGNQSPHIKIMAGITRNFSTSMWLRARSVKFLRLGDHHSVIRARRPPQLRSYVTGEFEFRTFESGIGLMLVVCSRHRGHKFTESFSIQTPFSSPPGAGVYFYCGFCLPRRPGILPCESRCSDHGSPDGIRRRNASALRTIK
jgi:hypothetical protein